MKNLNYQSDRKKIRELIGNRRFNIEEELKLKVKNILCTIREKGEVALYKYTKKFDQVELDNIKVTLREINNAVKEVDKEFFVSLDKAIINIKKFHEKQKQESWINNKQGKITGQLVNPLSRVGCYVPGGGAAYPSSALMTVIPALVAGVNEIVVTTPPDKLGKINPYTLATLEKLGIDEIYKIGGAQAVAALAYGTRNIDPVLKIVGPGNIYVTVAKKEVYGMVDIDMLAGPSEVMILADETADPGNLAADLLSQAEHDPRAIPLISSPSSNLLEKVNEELGIQLSDLDRKNIAQKSLDKNGYMIEVSSIEEGIELTNYYAPEHFELVVENPFSYLGQIKNAGAIFLGDYSPEPLGDYLAGPNHVLPTGGTARYASPLTTDDFIKKSSLIYYDKKSLNENIEDISRMARLEGLTAHARAVEKRKRGDS